MLPITWRWLPAKMKRALRQCWTWVRSNASRSFRYRRDLLELVDGDDDRFGGTFRYRNIVERGFCGMDIAQLEVEAGIAYRIESDAALQDDAVPESSIAFLPERFQTVDDHPAQENTKSRSDLVA